MPPSFFPIAAEIVRRPTDSEYAMMAADHAQKRYAADHAAWVAAGSKSFGMQCLEDQFGSVEAYEAHCDAQQERQHAAAEALKVVRAEAGPMEAA